MSLLNTFYNHKVVTTAVMFYNKSTIPKEKKISRGERILTMVLTEAKKKKG